MDLLEYQKLRSAIESEKQQRIQNHQARIATLAAEKGLAASSTLNLLAQGDSWFDYPLPLTHHSGIIDQLKGLHTQAPEILSLAHYGEAAEAMLGVKKLHELIDALRNPDNGKFDAILFSGGGNDLAGDQFRLWLKDAQAVGNDSSKAIDEARLADILGVVAAAYTDLFQARDRFAPGTPVFGHAYDFAIPTGEGVCCIGPWLKPGLDDRGWRDASVGTKIVKTLLLRFDALLADLEAQASNNFIYVRTQGCLLPSQWANELHPTPDGFKTVTKRFVAALRERFPGRI
jgi:hypothetical protein